jgi:hypothetical protein
MHRMWEGEGLHRRCCGLAVTLPSHDLACFHSSWPSPTETDDTKFIEKPRIPISMSSEMLHGNQLGCRGWTRSISIESCCAHFLQSRLDRRHKASSVATTKWIRDSKWELGTRGPNPTPIPVAVDQGTCNFPFECFWIWINFCAFHLHPKSIYSTNVISKKCGLKYSCDRFFTLHWFLQDEASTWAWNREWGMGSGEKESGEQGLS